MQARAPNVVDYRNRISLDLFARDLDRVLSKQQKQAITLELMEQGLMLIPFWLRPVKFLVGVHKWRRIMNALWEQHDDLLDGIWRESQEHMTRGTDQVDPQSAGGFNSAEMALFTDLVDRVGYRPGNNLVMTALRDGFFQDSTVANAAQLKEEFGIA